MTNTIYSDLLCRANGGYLSTKGVELRGDKFTIYEYDLFFLMPFKIANSPCRKKNGKNLEYGGEYWRISALSVSQD